MISRSLSSEAAIAAIGVGVMTLHQFLEARLDVDRLPPSSSPSEWSAFRSALRTVRRSASLARAAGPLIAEDPEGSSASSPSSTAGRSSP